MKFQEAMMKAQELVTACEENPYVPVKLELNAENKVLIEELIELVNILPYMNYRVLGEAKSEHGYFVMSAKIEKQTPGTNNVIHVDFKSKRRILAA